MSRPIMLDLFCCGGGASRGYDNGGARSSERVATLLEVRPTACFGHGLSVSPPNAGHTFGVHVPGNGAQAVGAAVGHAAGWKVAAEAMGIDWMRRSELTQAIPPVMTEYIIRFAPGMAVLE